MATQIDPEVAELAVDEFVKELYKRDDWTGAVDSLLGEEVRAEDSPASFAKYFAKMHGTELHSEGVKWIENAYEAHRQGKGLAQKCHRESGKTTVFSLFYASYLVGKYPHKTGAIIRINDDKANETAGAIKNIIDNDSRWKLFFPNIRPDERRGWSANGYNVIDTSYSAEEWENLRTKSAKGPSFVGYGWKSGSILGSRWNNFAITDDIHDEENTSSERQLRNVKKFVTDTYTPCLMKGCREIWNYTPWTMNDVYSYVESTGDFLVNETPVMRPAVEGDEGAYYWEEEEGIPFSGKWWFLYWPDVWNFERIGKYYRRMGAIGFARMMLLDLEATKGIHLKAEWLHDYPYESILDTWPVFFGVDYASVQDKIRDKERDYFALAIYRAVPGGGLVLADGFRGHLFKPEALDLVMTYWGMHPTLSRIGVESIGVGKEFYNDLVMLTDVHGRVPPLFEVKSLPKGGIGRVAEEYLAPRFQSSRIWISNKPTPFLNEFRNEWLLYPNAEHDDCLAAVAIGAFAAEGFMPSKADRTFKKKRQRNPYSLIQSM